MPHFYSALAVGAASIVLAIAPGCATNTDDTYTNVSKPTEDTPSPSSENVTPQDDEQVADAQNDIEPGDPDEIICKRTKVTGSKFNKRACQTRAQWEAFARDGREFTDEVIRRGLDTPVK